MKIQGRLDLIQSNLDFYCRLTSTSSYRSVEDLRKFFYSRFLDDARRNLKSIVSSKEKVVVEKENSGISDAKSFLNAVRGQTIDNNEEGISSPSAFLNAIKSGNEKIDEGADTGNSNASAFLSAVRSGYADESNKGTCLDDVEEVIDYKRAAEEKFSSVVKSMGATEGIKPVGGICLDDIISDTGVVPKEDVHGTLLDDVEVIIEPESIPEEVSDNIVEEEVHGIYLDDVVLEEARVEPVEQIVSKPTVVEDIHGIYLEDVEIIEDSDNGDCTEPIEEYEEPQQVEYEDTTQVFEEPYQAEVFEKPRVAEESHDGKVIPINDRIVVEVSVPPTVREFLKKHPGSEISEVEKYYPRKTIMKELKMGKIYKKGSKLFI